MAFLPSVPLERFQSDCLPLPPSPQPPLRRATTLPTKLRYEEFAKLRDFEPSLGEAFIIEGLSPKVFQGPQASFTAGDLIEVTTGFVTDDQSRFAIQLGKEDRGRVERIEDDWALIDFEKDALRCHWVDPANTPKLAGKEAPPAFPLDRATTEEECYDAWERIADSHSACFHHFSEERLDVVGTKQSFRIGRIRLPSSSVSCEEGEAALKSLGFEGFPDLKSLALMVGNDFVVAACNSQDSVDLRKLALLHESRKQPIPPELIEEYNDFLAVKRANEEKCKAEEAAAKAAFESEKAHAKDKGLPAPARPKKGKPSPEEIEEKQAERHRLRELENRIAESLRKQGANAEHVTRQLDKLKTHVGSLPTALADPALVQRLTGCIPGGVHPLRYCYVDQTVDVYIDSGPLAKIDTLPPEKRWFGMGGGTPVSCLFVPAAAFRRYAMSDAVVADIAKPRDGS